MVHRVDYHNVLKTVALSEDGKGTPVKLHLQSGVRSCDTERGVIALKNGDAHEGDVIIGADGIRVSFMVFDSTLKLVTDLTCSLRSAQASLVNLM